MNLKEEYNKAFIVDLANSIKANYPEFEVVQFQESILSQDWSNKELKQRMRIITNAMNQFLPIDYPEQLKHIVEVAKKYSGIQGFVFPDFVEVYGLENYEESMEALKTLTRYSTAEFAIRPFILTYPDAIKQMIIWSKDKNEHVRRLASEGARPKLPWAAPLKMYIENPEPVLPILEYLKNDDSLYVRKSVANHLNDISKSHPDLVIKICGQWYGKTTNTDWIVKHALRTLLKAGDKDALAIFGLSDASKLSINHLELSSNEITIGDSLNFYFTVKNEDDKLRNVRLEYYVYYLKSNNSLSKKVFQIGECKLNKGEAKDFNKKQSFKDLSTRKHYPGEHKIAIAVNGEEKIIEKFFLS